jgi:hypothetical protein
MNKTAPINLLNISIVRLEKENNAECINFTRGLYLYICTHTHINEYLEVSSTNSAKTRAFINTCEMNKSDIYVLNRNTVRIAYTGRT